MGRTSGSTIVSVFEPRHLWVVRFLSKILNTDMAKFGKPDGLKQLRRKCDTGEEGGGEGEFKNAGDDDGMKSLMNGVFFPTGFTPQLNLSRS